VNHRGHGACAFLLTAKSKTPQLTCKPNITGSREAFPMLASGDSPAILTFILREAANALALRSVQQMS
jgi:hypothetical protein